MNGEATAQEAVQLRERFASGYQYHVSTRTELSGSVQPPPETPGGVTPPPLTIRGHCKSEYDERYLTASGGTPPGPRTLRLYRDYQLSRTLTDGIEERTIRPGVRRMVIVPLGHRGIPFSPDGPLLLDEIDLVRLDMFTPGLVSLFPDKPVRPGDRWAVGNEAVAVMTDLEGIDEGAVDCVFEQVATLAGRRVAQVRFAGTVRGVSQDGPCRHRLDGSMYFDLDGHYLSYLSMSATNSLLSKEGHVQGNVEGRFVMTRQAGATQPRLADDAIRGLTTDHTTENTRLLYDNPELGVQFIHPRIWKARPPQGKQLTLTDPLGNGLLITLEPADRVPTVTAYQSETRDYLQSQKFALQRLDAPRRLRNDRPLDTFGYDADVGGKRMRLEYYVLREALGGATVAARLIPGRDYEAARQGVEMIAKTLSVKK